MNKKVFGVVIGIVLLVSVMVFGGIAKLNQSKEPEIVINGLIGGEKVELFESEKFKRIAKEKYHTTIQYSKSGSIEMADRDLNNMDYLFPSSQVAEELIKLKNGDLITKSETVLNSPIVLISWGEIVDAFAKEGIFKKENNAYYIVDTQKFLNLIVEGKEWSSVGLADLYGNISVVSTHPSKSNSGNMFAGLLANMMNGGNVVDEQTLPDVLPKVKTFYSKLGYLENSSGDLFEQFLRTGMGAKPIIVGYENQLVEFATANPETWEQVKEDIRIVYPTPTVWSEHPVMALNKNGEKLIEILSDPEVQELAWKEHGFRTGLTGVENNPEDLAIEGLPKTIKSIIPMPTPQVMNKIVKALED